MRRRWLLLFVVLALVAASCGGDDDDGAAAGDTGAADTDTGGTDTGGDDLGGDSDSDGGDDLGGDSDSGGGDDLGGDSDSGDDLGGDSDSGDDGAGDDPCEGVELEASEIGITADTIKIVAMADTGSELAPGLFQGAIDGVNAWAEVVNANGGLACRMIEVIEADSKINPTETTNGFLQGCEEAVAMVGTYALFATDMDAQQNCSDLAGNAIGIPDFAGLANNPPQQCSPNTFTLNANSGGCPYTEGVRDWSAHIGAAQWILENDPIVADGANGIFLIPADLPSTINSGTPIPIAQRDVLNILIDGMFGVSGFTAQSEYGEFVATAQGAGSNWFQNGSNDISMLNLLRESDAQGFDLDTAVKYCQLACYTEAFRDEPLAENTYVWGTFLPYGDRDSSEELALFLDNVGLDFPQSWAVTGWAAGRLFEQLVNEIVAAEGPNGITRQRLLDAAAATDNFDSNGLIGALDFADGRYDYTPCFVLMQVQDGDYVRVEPAEPGTFNCEDDNISPLSIDGLATLDEF